MDVLKKAKNVKKAKDCKCYNDEFCEAIYYQYYCKKVNCEHYISIPDDLGGNLDGGHSKDPVPTRKKAR